MEIVGGRGGGVGVEDRLQCDVGVLEAGHVEGGFATAAFLHFTVLGF